jgi:hypothetical protein
MPTEQLLEIYHGDTVPISLVFADTDLTGATVYLRGKLYPHADDAMLVIDESQAVHINPAAGETSIDIPEAVVNQLAVDQKYFCWVQVEWPDLTSTTVGDFFLRKKPAPLVP